MWNVLSQLLAKMSKVIVDEYDKTDICLTVMDKFLGIRAREQK